MKKLMLLLLVLLSLAGCSAPVDGRLAEADSLLCAGMKEKAFTILKSVSPGSLRGRGNRAYYALLYTQSQYKCYEPIRSDSLIDIAVDYYDGSGDYDKHLRSLIYKGAALADMGDRLEAIDWYKKAEEAADTADYDNLGYINLRLASLYGESFIENDEHITKLKKALDYFHKARNKEYELMCMSRLGAFYRAIDLDIAKYYLDNAVKFSKELNDSSNYFYNLGMLSCLYEMQGKHNRAKELSLYIINNGQNFLNDDNVYYNITISYARLDMVDSAQYYLNLTDYRKAVSPQERTARMLAQIAASKAERDYKTAYYLNDSLNNYVDSVINASKSTELYAIEKKFDKQRLELQNAEMRGQRLYYAIAILLLLFLVTLLAIAFVKHKNTFKSYESLLEQARNEKLTMDRLLEDAVRQNASNNLIDTLKHQIVTIRHLLECSYRSIKPGDFMQEFKNCVSAVKTEDSYWADLRSFVNAAYNGVINTVESQYPELSEVELNFIGLMCCGFSNIEMMVCMGYTNERSVCNRRLSIAKKMNLKEPLDKYLQRLTGEKRQD